MGASAAAIKLAQGYVAIGTDLDPFHKGIGTVKTKMQGLAKWVGVLGAGMQAMGGALAAPIIGSLRAFADYGDQQMKAARRTYLTSRAMSEMTYVATLAGGGIGTVEAGIRGMNMAMRQLREGSATTTREFAAMGLSLEDLENLSVEDRFWTIATAIANYSDESRRGELAMAAFSRGGMQMLPMIDMGADAIAKARAEARRFGVSLDQETGEAAEELTDQMYRLRSALLGIKISIARVLAPEVIELTNKLLDVLVVTRQWLDDHPEFIRGVANLAKWLVLIGGAAVLAAGGIIALTSGMGLAAVAFGGIVAGIMAAGEASGLINAGFEDLKATFTGWAPVIETMASGIVSTLKSGAKSFIAILIDGFLKLDPIIAEIGLSLAASVGYMLTQIKIMGQPILSATDYANAMVRMSTDAARNVERRSESMQQRQAELRQSAAADAFNASMAFGAVGQVIGERIADMKARMDEAMGGAGGTGSGLASLLGLDNLSASGVMGAFGYSAFSDISGKGNTIQRDLLESSKRSESLLEEIAENTSDSAPRYG